MKLWEQWMVFKPARANNSGGFEGSIFQAEQHPHQAIPFCLIHLLNIHRTCAEVKAKQDDRAVRKKKKKRWSHSSHRFHFCSTDKAVTLVFYRLTVRLLFNMIKGPPVLYFNCWQKMGWTDLSDGFLQTEIDSFLSFQEIQSRFGQRSPTSGQYVVHCGPSQTCQEELRWRRGSKVFYAQYCDVLYHGCTVIGLMHGILCTVLWCVVSWLYCDRPDAWTCAQGQATQTPRLSNICYHWFPGMMPIFEQLWNCLPFGAFALQSRHACDRVEHSFLGLWSTNLLSSICAHVLYALIWGGGGGGEEGGGGRGKSNELQCQKLGTMKTKKSSLLKAVLSPWMVLACSWLCLGVSTVLLCDALSGLADHEAVFTLFLFTFFCQANGVFGSWAPSWLGVAIHGKVSWYRWSRFSKFF